MENNDSPKTLKNSEDTVESIEEIITTSSEEKRRKRTKNKKKNKKSIKHFLKEVTSLKIKNTNNKLKNLIFDNNNKSKYYKYVGKTIFLFMDKYDNPLLIIGPHWPLFLCFL